MRRSAFMRMSSSVLSVAALAPRTARAANGEVVDYALTSRRIVSTPTPGVRVAGVGFNGRLPGPVLRVTHGQRVRVRYTNHCGEPTSVHWHGMILPNAMDGVAGITQAAVADGGSFVYDFAPDPPGTRWYHDHAAGMAAVRGLFGLFIVEDPRDEPADKEFALCFHDMPSSNASLDAAMRGTSNAPMTDPQDSMEVRAMHPGDRMGDEVAYAAHCVNGAAYPRTRPLRVDVGDRVRLRVLNANQTQTRYVRLAGHRLRVTHADGNPLAQAVVTDVLRLGAAERYDAWFEVTRPGAWLLQGISSNPLAYEQAVLIHTAGMEHAAPQGSPQVLHGADVLTYERAGAAGGAFVEPAASITKHLLLEGGDYGSSRWTINGNVWPNAEKIAVSRGDTVVIRFTNNTDMDHPMHLHGHTFAVVEIGGKQLQRPIAKDVSLVPGNGGTLSWRFRATSPPGRWLLHCHNQIHMMDGMMTEVVYR